MMPDSLDLVVLEIPSRVADLAFRVSVPRDWKSHELPAEEVDFSSPGTFFPLLLVTAPWAAVVLTVAGRPGFEDGTLQDWSLFLLDSQGIRPTEFGPAGIGNVQGLIGRGRQQQEGTWLEIRFAFFEDGGRLVHLGLLAPEAISAPLDAVWQTALESFVLERPQGPNVPLGPGMGVCPEPVADGDSDVPQAEVEAAAVSAEPATSPESVSPPPGQFTDSDLGYYAKSDDLATLDPEHPINARLREQGVGFVPNLLETDLEAKSVKIGAGAIGAMIRVALGWHVNDDGRRMVVLDPDGKVQINLSLIAKEGRSVDRMLDEIQEEAAESYSNPRFLRLEDGGIRALSVRNIVVNNEPIEQLHMLTPWVNDSAMLRARVTAEAGSMRFAANYADLILKSAEYGHEAEVLADLASEGEPEKSDRLPWQQRVEQLELEDRLEEAEQLFRDKIPSLHCAIAIAELYRRRWVRLRESDPGKAAKARRQAADWARTYGSWATSGGEGAALSLERDEFLRRLGPEPLDSST